ncbi:MAG: Gfo/Idh/MocA family oxidoreductase, partial [Desulfobacterales bacterium]|nr:Gfo/Idh/MocA family oxidoreductase [Desulfobacterales bacterium]
MTDKSTVNLALIGIGAWSGSVGDAMMKSGKVNLVACFDPVPEKRKAFSDRFGCEEENSYEDILKRDDIDGLHLATPNSLHAEQTLLAARHRKHVFVEKPIANTIEDGRKMIEACQKAGVVLMVGHQLRRLTGIRKVKELIEAGTIGS